MDWLLLGAFGGLLVLITVLGFTTRISHLWTPQFLIDLAGS
jgi:hypothetical protein